jgi:hypothetical protein
MPRLSVLFLILSALFASAAHAQAQRTVERTLDLAPGGHVELDTHSGHINVESWDEPRVAVEVRIDGDEQEHVDKTKIRFDHSGDELTIESDFDALSNGLTLFGISLFQSPTQRPDTDYTVRMPRTAALTLDVYSADASVPALEAPLTFDGYSGDLQADHVAGEVSVDTYSGDAQIDRLDGRLAGDTYSGDVQVDSLAGSATFDAYSGSATLTFAALTGECAFDTYSGDIAVTLPSSTGAVIETTVDALNTDLPVQLEQRDDRIRATLGEGGPRLRFNTYSGTLTLRSE